MKLPKTINVFHVEKRNVKSTVFVNPLREWFVALCVVCIVMFGLFGYAGFLLYQEMQGGETIVVPNETLVSYRRADAALIINEYEKRAEAFATLRADRSHAYIPQSPEVSERKTPLAEERVTE